MSVEHHNIKPIYNSESVILILGSFPSVKSRNAVFYYAHPQNRFWKVISSILNTAVPNSDVDKKQLLLNNKIAVWDVIKECEITGSSDSSIKDVVPNDIEGLISNTNISCIITNGKKAHELFNKYIELSDDIKVINLPSTSPANATWSLDKLVDEWGSVFNLYL